MGFPAARLTDLHICPMVDGLKPHVGGPVMVGAPNVLVRGLPAANLGTQCTCVGAPDAIVRGSATVQIGGRPAARMFDQTAHGGVVMSGALNVLIGG